MSPENANMGGPSGGAPPETNRVTEADILRLNREIAYLGRVGRRREEYCREQVKYMQACHSKIGQDQLLPQFTQGSSNPEQLVAVDVQPLYRRKRLWLLGSPHQFGRR